jgi:TRAP-type C4-dicarboxylate transport system permease large subunit
VLDLKLLRDVVSGEMDVQQINSVYMQIASDMRIILIALRNGVVAHSSMRDERVRMQISQCIQAYEHLAVWLSVLDVYMTIELRQFIID